MKEFMPPNQRGLVIVTSFVTHVMRLYHTRKEMIDIHFQQVTNRQRHSGRNNVIQSSVSVPSTPIPNSTANNPPLTVDSNSVSSTDSDDSLDQVINSNVIRFGTQPNINEGCSNSLSSNNNSNEGSSQSNEISLTTVNVMLQLMVVTIIVMRQPSLITRQTTR